MRQLQSLAAPGAVSLARAVVAGFVATVVMTLTFFVAYGLAPLLSRVEFIQDQRGEVLAGWFERMAHNQVIDLGASNLYLAVIVHLVAGLGWALVYAYAAEPRLTGPGWQRGILFSLAPWLLSLVVFLPLVGGGFFGLATGAGPLPTLGNLILHLVYGAILGTVYRVSGPLPLEEGPMSEVDRRLEFTTLRFTAIGMLIGAGVGAGVGVLLATLPEALATQQGLGVPRWYLLGASLLIGGAWGGLVGSLSGLSVTPAEEEKARGVETLGISTPGPSQEAKGPPWRAVMWQGQVPPDRWMDFYSDVVRRLPSQEDLEVQVTVRVQLTGPVQEADLERVREGLRQFGLSDGVTAEA